MRLFPFMRDILSALYQTFCRGINGLKSISHPNVLPVVEVSETLFPLCIMTPWMAGGNIIQYTRVNPGANRLMLVLAHQLRIDYHLLTTLIIVGASMPGPHAPSRVRYFAWCHCSGRETEEMNEPAR